MFFYPKLKTLNVKQTKTILVSTTHNSTRIKQVIDNCKNCNYHHKYKEIIPVIRSNYKSSSRSTGYCGGLGGGGGGGDGG